MMSINLIEKYNNQNKESVKWRKLAPWIVMFLLLPPIVGLPVIIYHIWNNKTRTKTDYYAFMFCIAIYMGAINATKIPGGDQMQYHMAYLNVPIQGFIGSLTYIYGYNAFEGGATGLSGEFMNGVYNYIGYYLTFGYYPLFAALLTFADYMLIFAGLYNVCLSMKFPHKPIVCGVLILSFFYLFFNYTLQIQKQFLAQCIMMYALGLYAATGKRTLKIWLIVLCAVFTHASTYFFVPFFVFKQLRDRLTKRWLLFIVLILVAFIIYGPSIVSEVSSDNNSSVIGYGAQRFADLGGQTDLVSGLQTSQVIVIAIPMFLIVFRQLWIKRHCFIDSSQAFILNVTLFLLLAITSMYSKPLAQYRYFMMLLTFMPFVYPFISTNIKNRNRFLCIISVVMVVWFYVAFTYIPWHYADEWKIIAYPPAALISIGY